MTSFNTVTLADVRDQLIADTNLLERKQRDLISAIDRITTYLHRPAEDITAAPHRLRQLLAGIHPVQAGVSAKSLSNVKANLAAALRMTGNLPQIEDRAPLTAAWKEFLNSATAQHQVRGLSRLTTFCCNRGIEPSAVTDAAMADFRVHLDETLLTNDPAELCRELTWTWNSVARRQPKPFAELERAPRTRYQCPALATYPKSLQDDLQTYLDRLSHTDIFAEDGPDKALKPVSLRNISAYVRQFLAALVEVGQDPDTFVDLRAVVGADNIRIGAQAIRSRRATPEVPVGIYNIIAALLAIARHHLRLPEPEIARISRMKGQIKPSNVGMTPKNRQRLGQFADWANVVRLVTLPQNLIEAARAQPDLKTAHLRAMYAAAVCILLSCPMRIKNLADLDIDRHLYTTGVGPSLRYTLRVDADEVKNNNHIEVKLTGKNSKVLHLYIMHFRHRLSQSDGTALFPRKGDGSSRRAVNFGQALGEEIYRETGLVMNPHLFRHFAAYLYLRERPGDYETVRRLLRHKKLETTMQFYAELSNQWAHEHYDDVVLKKFGGGDA